MKQYPLALALGVMLGIGTTVVRSESEKQIQISKIPEEVTAAAQKAVPGIKFTEAEIHKSSEGVVYEIEGVAEGKDYEINVSADGEVLAVREDDDAGEATETEEAEEADDSEEKDD